MESHKKLNTITSQFFSFTTRHNLRIGSVINEVKKIC